MHEAKEGQVFFPTDLMSDITFPFLLLDWTVEGENAKTQKT